MRNLLILYEIIAVNFENVTCEMFYALEIMVMIILLKNKSRNMPGAGARK